MTTPNLTDLDEETAYFVEIAPYDWFVTQNYNRLHWADLTAEQLSTVPEYMAALGPIRLACGRVASRVAIPGIFTRMGAMRCTGCCRATGMPQGKGSPKNDDACRKVLGLSSRKESAAAVTAKMDKCLAAEAEAREESITIDNSSGERAS